LNSQLRWSPRLARVNALHVRDALTRAVRTHLKSFPSHKASAFSLTPAYIAGWPRIRG